MKYTRFTLTNGLRVLFAPRSETDAVTVLAMTKVGSRYETPRNNGISHFLEHMMFKGTAKRPTAQAVAKELDGVGANFNAFTGRDYTGYYVHLNHEHLKLGLDVIADMLWHSRFSADEINRERTVIIEEINMYLDNPIMLLEELFEQRLFGKSHPLGRLIAGPKDVIRRLNRDDIVGYFRRHYFPANMVLAVAGRFSPPTARRLVERLFGGVTHRRPGTSFRPFHLRQQRPQASVVYRETEQVQLGLGFLGLPYVHKDLPALTLLSVIVGGNMSSRLFTRVREREGLAYSVHASRSSYQDTGTFFIQAGIDKTRLNDAVRVILEELNKMKRQGATNDELARAKEFVRGKITLQLENSEHVADFLARQELLTNRIKTPDEQFAEFHRVSRPDIQRVARRVFRPGTMNAAIIGPYRRATDIERLLTRR